MEYPYNVNCQQGALPVSLILWRMSIMTTNKIAATVSVSDASIADLLVKSFDAKAKSESSGAVVAKMIAERFAQCDSDASFEAAFGNGKLGKENTAGSLRLAVEDRIKKLTKEKQAGVLHLLKVRLSETRKLHRAGGFPQKGETVQQALKRYASPKAAQTEGHAKAFSIPEEMTADALATALSEWAVKQTPAKLASLAKELPDFLPAAKPAAKKRAA